MTQVAINEPKEVVPFELPSDGTETIAPTYPVVSIVQPMSQIPKAIPGFFHHSDKAEQTDSFDGVLLVMRDTRAMFVDTDDKPVCRSNDGVVPVPNQRLWSMENIVLNSQKMAVPPITPKDCANCVFSDWGENGAAPPACGNAYVVIAARNGDPEDLVQLRLKGTSIRPFRQWVSRTLKPHKLRLYQHAVHLTTEEKTGPSRKWHQLVVESNAIPMDDVLTYADLLGQHSIQDVEVDHEFE